MRRLLGATFFAANLAFANPYPDADAVPKDQFLKHLQTASISLDLPSVRKDGHDVLRIELSWENENWKLAQAITEKSGTEALLHRALLKNPLGSFKAELRTAKGVVFYDAIGTGAEFRKLTRALTFRFPLPTTDFELVVTGEHPKSGKPETIFSQTVKLTQLTTLTSQEVEVRQLKDADESPSLIVNVYAEGYLASRKEKFWKDAQKLSQALIK
jgi:hypothetical protein